MSEKVLHKTKRSVNGLSPLDAPGIVDKCSGAFSPQPERGPEKMARSVRKKKTRRTGSADILSA
jgi:hypothetical protein